MIQILSKSVFETINILKIVLPAIFFGLVASCYIYSISYFKKFVEYIAKMLISAKLRSGVAVAAFLIHPVTAYTLLTEMINRGIIDDKEVIIAVLIGTFPRTLRLTVLFLIPIALPILGFWGVYYIALILLSRFIISVVGIILARKTLNASGKVDLKPFEIELKDTIKRFFKISITLSLTILLVMLLFNAGLMKIFDKSLMPYLSQLGLPPASLIIIMTGFPSMLAAIATAGSLLSKNMIFGENLIVSLILASIAHSFVEVSRNTLPVATSIMGKSLGFKVALTILISRISANIVALILCFILFRYFVV